MRWIAWVLTCALLAGAAGCEAVEDNPRTAGTIGGAAVGAGAGALIDRDKPLRGAAIGGAIGGVGGNVGGEVYKENR